MSARMEGAREVGHEVLRRMRTLESLGPRRALWNCDWYSWSRANVCPQGRIRAGAETLAWLSVRPSVTWTSWR